MLGNVDTIKNKPEKVLSFMELTNGQCHLLLVSQCSSYTGTTSISSDVLSEFILLCLCILFKLLRLAHSFFCILPSSGFLYCFISIWQIFMYSSRLSLRCLFYEASPETLTQAKLVIPFLMSAMNHLQTSFTLNYNYLITCMSFTGR